MPEPREIFKKGASGKVIEFASQMLRFVVSVAFVDPEKVKNEEQIRKLISNHAIMSTDFAYFTENDDVSDVEPEAAQLSRDAEDMAIALFEDIFRGGGCGEEGCCGPHGAWYEQKKPNPERKNIGIAEAQRLIEEGYI